MATRTRGTQRDESRSRRSATSPAPSTHLLASSNGSKLATVVADLIVGDIAALGWPEGQVLGSEPDLLERYQVSRAVFREAVRLLEHLQVARMRRGPGGGLVILGPTVDSVTDAVAVYLSYVGAEIEEVLQARLALEERAVELATERLEEDDIAALRDLAARERSGDVENPRVFHNAVAGVARNPALAFFVDLLNRMTLLYLPERPTFSKATMTKSVEAHSAIIEAIVSGDAGLARGRMRKHLTAEIPHLKAARPSRQRLTEMPDARARSDKRAEQLTREILAEVVAADWPVGTSLGSETELTKRYGVSRAVLREAVRVLEHHQVVSMRRGPSGGLFVTEPGVSAIADALALHTHRLGIVPSQLFEVRVVVEMAVLEGVMASLDGESFAAMHAVLASERDATLADFAVIGHDLHCVLAGIAGNRVLELLTLVLIRLTRFSIPVPAEMPEAMTPRTVTDVHQAIVDAIAARDIDVARVRMRTHLDTLMGWMR